MINHNQQSAYTVDDSRLDKETRATIIFITIMQTEDEYNVTYNDMVVQRLSTTTIFPGMHFMADAGVQQIVMAESLALHQILRLETQ